MTVRLSRDSWIRRVPGQVHSRLYIAVKVPACFSSSKAKGNTKKGYLKSYDSAIKQMCIKTGSPNHYAAAALCKAKGNTCLGADTQSIENPTVYHRASLAHPTSVLIETWKRKTWCTRFAVHACFTPLTFPLCCTRCRLSFHVNEVKYTPKKKGSWQTRDVFGANVSTKGFVFFRPCRSRLLLSKRWLNT